MNPPELESEPAPCYARRGRIETPDDTHQCPILKCAHAFQCEGFKITLHSSSQTFLQYFTKKNT